MNNRKKNNEKIYTGEHGEYEFHGIFPQKGGTAPKVKRVAAPTNPEKTLKDQIEFIEKSETFGEPGSIVKEKICLDFYGSVSRAPSSRLALRTEDEIRQLLTLHPLTPNANPLLNTQYDPDPQGAFLQTVNDMLAGTPKYGKSNDPRYVTFLGKMVKGYSDLGDDFVKHIEEKGAPPEVIRKDNIDYPLEGLMQLAAMAKILGDPDWLGASGSNTGFVLEGGKAKSVLVDAGMALNHLEGTNRQRWESKNIQFGNQANVDIQFDKLSAKQKEQFIGTLYEFTHDINLKQKVKSLVTRNGEFNSQKDKNGNTIVVLDNRKAEVMTQSIIRNVNRMKNLYSVELSQHHVIKRIDEAIENYKAQQERNPNMERYEHKIKVLEATKNYLNGNIGIDILNAYKEQYPKWDKTSAIKSETEKLVNEAISVRAKIEQPPERAFVRGEQPELERTHTQQHGNRR